ncbi:Glucose transporter, partial [Globisporangium polare]
MAESRATPTTADATFVQLSTPSAAQHKPTEALVDDATVIATRTFQPTTALYASVFVAFMLPFQYGWSLSQLNLSTFANQDDCDARPVADGT